MAAATIPKGTIQPNHHLRETVESIVVAFILAFLFRAFVAEAFVIPTGSMAPTLMGAHKDLYCNQCGSRYQVGASLEFDSQSGARTGNYVIGSHSSICRAVNPIDFNDANQATFSGDRILVSKFDYVLSKPQRWDVLVFKFPEEARMNYIKRLVGLPGEQILIQEGDIYTRTQSNAPWVIARKPAHKVLAVRQPVADTSHQAAELVKRGFPSLWQPWSEGGKQTPWQVNHSPEAWSANLSADPQTSWLRYYHKDLTPRQWLAVEQGQQLPEVSPTQSQLITDFLAYNSYYAKSLRQQDIREIKVDDLVQQPQSENGVHWVGDLIGEFDVEVESSSGQLCLQVVEFGLEFQVAIDITTGDVQLTAWDASQLERSNLDGFFSGESELVAACKIRGPGRYQVALANVDDQILLWVNGRLVKFNRPAEFDSWSLRDDKQRRPFWLESRPLDAAPIAIGGKDIDMTVHRAQVFRDLYYTAVQRHGYRNYDSTDFGQARSRLRAPDVLGNGTSGMDDDEIIAAVYAKPKLWQTTALFSLRNKNEYTLGEGQYFPLGDNSAQSSDARMWERKFVDEKYLLGKALLVFWPHYWNRPIPFLPDFGRMGLIR
ncbi:MAG: signal peptidase I [Pirellulaceae bacterium]|nr:signal peptidase I [Pirellulaceae bacterium]